MTILEIPSPHPTGETPTAPFNSAPAGTDTLFYAPGATEGTTQWKAEVFQVVNWGGFEGRVRFQFHPGATLISGHSGTGKSTLLDAYIALMMPSNTPFNGASNDGGGGRARGDEQRSLLSYLRGKTDTVSDAAGRQVDLLLRGRNTPTWGAVGMTFVNDHGQRFTAFRVYYVPAQATIANQIIMRLATVEDQLDLADLALAVEGRFAPKTLAELVPGLRTYDAYAKFADTLYARLGIGANGDGLKALQLLVRIQAGHQIRTVDTLYKDMVLERPPTFDDADRAIGHFDSLEAAYLAMLVEQHKAELLAPITGWHEALVRGRAEIATLDVVGATRSGDTPLLVWSLQTEARLLDADANRNQEHRVANRDALRVADQTQRNLELDLDTARDEHQDAGGADLDRLARDIDATLRDRDTKQVKRDTLAARITALGVPVTDQSSFSRLTTEAADFLARYDDLQAEVEQHRMTLLREQAPILSRRDELRADLESLRGRAGRIPRHLDELRRQVAASAGLSPSELPFVAELVDIAPEESGWRTAAETVLGGVARTMLVPESKFDHFSRAIDRMQLRGRITFQGVQLVPHRPVHADPDRLSGKLVYKESPFSTWVAGRLSDRSLDALCVADVTGLDGPGLRVTPAGQTRDGRRGAHGRNEQTNIIGFDNADTVADLEEQLRGIAASLADLDERDREVRGRVRLLDARRLACIALQDVTWDEIDTDTATARLEDLHRRRRDILSADDRLRALQQRVEDLEHQLQDQRKRVWEQQQTRTCLETEQGSIVDRQDQVSDEIDRIAAGRAALLTAAQAARLDAEFAAAVAPADPADRSAFEQNLIRLQSRLREAIRAAQATADRAEADLVRVFTTYQTSWEDPNLGTSMESYPDYARILDNIVSTGLHERRNEWRRRLTSWSGDDLVPLLRSMNEAVDEIKNRLDPINDILRTLEFGPNRDRLAIRLRVLKREEVSSFRSELQKLSATATADLDDAAVERRFRQLQRFMARIRERNDARADPKLTNRDDLLDVRQHVEITAEAATANGTVRSTYTTLGGKSGGETQELVAFIVGAALRFRLGDEERTRPRFAPVFLDEGFVKADGQFAGRAVQAWKGLGFQLIVGAPVDKVTALEPHMDELLGITKNEKTHYSFVNRIRDAGRASAPAGAREDGTEAAE